MPLDVCNTVNEVVIAELMNCHVFLSNCTECTLTDLVNFTHRHDLNYKKINGKQCREKVAADSGDSKNKVSSMSYILLCSLHEMFVIKVKS